MKNTIKKIFCILFVLSCSLSAKAEYDFKVNGLFYKVISFENLTCACVDENNTPDSAQRSKYSGDIAIPSSVTFGERSFSVIEVSENAFWGSDINSVRIGGNIKIIRTGAFQLCEKLTTVYLEDGVEIIEAKAFSGCDKLKNLRLSNSIREIGYCAFTSSRELTGNITIPNTCKVIGEEVFPEGKYGGGGAFSITLSDGTSTLEMYKYAFGRLGGESIYIGRNLSSNYHYVGIYEFDDVIFGDNVTFMPDCYRTSGSSEGKIRTLIIGKSISKVPPIKMFEIESLRVKNPVPPKAEGFLEKVYLNTTLYIPKGSLEAYQNADIWKNFWTIKEVEMR